MWGGICMCAIVSAPQHTTPHIQPHIYVHPQGLLNKRPSDRLTWPTLLDHPFVRETSNERLVREQHLAQAAAAAGATRGWRGEHAVVPGVRGVPAPGGGHTPGGHGRPSSTHKHRPPLVPANVQSSATVTTTKKGTGGSTQGPPPQQAPSTEQGPSSTLERLLSHVEDCCASTESAERLWQDPAMVDALLQLLRPPPGGGAPGPHPGGFASTTPTHAQEQWASDTTVSRALRSVIQLLRVLHRRADAVEVLAVQVARAVHVLCGAAPSVAALVLEQLVDAEQECAGASSRDGGTGMVGFGPTVQLYVQALGCADVGVRAAAARGVGQQLQRAHVLVGMGGVGGGGGAGGGVQQQQRALQVVQYVRTQRVATMLCKVCGVFVHWW